MRYTPSAAAAPSPWLPVQPLCAEYSKIYGRSRSKRLPMTTKRAKKGYYKGNACTQEGRHTSKGGYVMDRSLMLELAVPSLTGFKVRALSIVCANLGACHQETPNPPPHSRSLVALFSCSLARADIPTTATAYALRGERDAKALLPVGEGPIRATEGEARGGLSAGRMPGSAWVLTRGSHRASELLVECATRP